MPSRGLAARIPFGPASGSPTSYVPTVSGARPQARKAEILFTENGAGLEATEVPATLTKCPRKWVQRWRWRWGVAIRAVAKVSDLSDAVVRARVEGFWAYCKQLLAAEPNALWVNFDETPLWYSQQSGRTNVRRSKVRGKRPVRLVGKPILSRKRTTVGLTISTDAAFAAEVLVFVVFRGDGGRRPESPNWDGVIFPDGVEARWQECAWMTEDLVMECVCLLTEVRDRVYGPDRVLVLVWDSFRAHLTDAVKILCRESGVKMVVIPSGVTSLLQDLDTHVNKAFKAYCRAWWRRYTFDLEDPARSVLTNQDFVHLIRDAAADALAQTVPSGALQGCNTGSASFLHNGLTNALDGSEDHLVNVRHRAVDPARRAGLPSVLAETAPVAPDPEPDPGYGAPPSDDGMPTLGIEAPSEEEGDEGEAGRRVIQRIGAERDRWLDGLASGAAGSGSGGVPLRGFIGPAGARRSTRRVRVAPPKQDLFGGGVAKRGAVSPPRVTTILMHSRESPM